MSVAATRFAHAEGRVCLAYKSDGEKVGEGRGVDVDRPEI